MCLIVKNMREREKEMKNCEYVFDLKFYKILKILL